MATTIQDMPPVARGYVYAFQMQVTDGEPPFPAGAAFRAEIRDYAGADTLAGTVSTAAGSIRRVDDATLEIELDGTITGKLGNTTVSLDLVRTDVAPERYVGILIQLPVVRPVTQPRAAA